MNPYNDQVFIIDKASGPTSFDVVEAMRRAARLRKVGHTGTLDPLAGGVLVLCTGVATRASDLFVDLEKEYSFTVRLGVETTTLDAEGEVVRESPVPGLEWSEIESAVSSFQGAYEFVPPRYSAIKKDGERLCDRARRGEAPDIPSRTSTIYQLELLSVELPEIRARVRCSRGTYIRSLARDLGHRLGLPAHLAQLTRTRVGPFRVEDGFSSDRIARGDMAGLEGVTLDMALSFLPGVVLSSRSKRALVYGTLPGSQDIVRVVGEIGEGPLRMLDDEGTLLAIGRRNEAPDRNRLSVVDRYRLFVDHGYLLGHKPPAGAGAVQ